MTQPATRNAPMTVTIALIAAGVILAVIGVVYLTLTAAHLPAFFPGHQAGSAHHHTKHALAAFGLAVLSWIAAWFTTGTRNRTRTP